MTTDKCKDLNYKNRLSLQSIPATIYKNRARSWEKFYHLHSLVNKVCSSYCTVCFKIWGIFESNKKNQSHSYCFLFLSGETYENIPSCDSPPLLRGGKRYQQQEQAVRCSVHCDSHWNTVGGLIKKDTSCALGLDFDHFPLNGARTHLWEPGSGTSGMNQLLFAFPPKLFQNHLQLPPQKSHLLTDLNHSSYFWRILPLNTKFMCLLYDQTYFL